MSKFTSHLTTLTVSHLTRYVTCERFMEPLDELISKLNIFNLTISLFQQLTHAYVAFG